MTHKELVLRAENWLKRRCSFVFTEFYGGIAVEIPDVIGWNMHGISTLIECKASRADFLSDKHKYFRKHVEVGMGNYRYYLCPSQTILEKDLPNGWGLLYTTPKQIRTVVKPKVFKADYKCGNMKRNEMGMLISALRRVYLRGDLEKIYDFKTVDIDKN